MVRDFSDLTRREARTILFVDSDFTYDNVQKGRKLAEYINERRLFHSLTAKRFEKKFIEYCNEGVPGSMCPLCGDFAEGKGRLLCKDCVEALEEIAEMPVVEKKKSTQKASVQLEAKPIKFEVINGRKDVAIENERAKTTARIEEKLGLIDRSKFFIIPKRKMIIGAVAFVAVTFMINLFVVMPYMNRLQTIPEQEVAIIENDAVPTGISIE